MSNGCYCRSNGCYCRSNRRYCLSNRCYCRSNGRYCLSNRCGRRNRSNRNDRRCGLNVSCKSLLMDVECLAHFYSADDAKNSAEKINACGNVCSYRKDVKQVNKGFGGITGRYFQIKATA